MIVDSLFEARVRDITFRGGFGFEPGFYVSEVDGLLSGGEVTTDDVPRGFGPGAQDTDNRREDPRIITLRGLIVAASMRDLGKMITQLGNLLVEEDDRAEFTWTEFEEWRFTHVQRGTGWSIVRGRSTGTASFSVRFRAADQRVYATELQRGEWGVSVPVVNRGGYPAPVVLEVQGDSSVGYTVVGPRGAALVVQRPIVSGSVHQYLSDEQVLLVDGVPQVEGITRSDRIDIPPGAWGYGIDHGCLVRASHRDTWIP